MSEVIIHCANHIWVDLISKLPISIQKKCVKNDKSLDEIIKIYKKNIEELFGDIQTDHHKCNRVCFHEYLYENTVSDKKLIDLNDAFRLAKQILSSIPDFLFDDQKSRDTIPDRILSVKINNVKYK